jgi:hypothetical protein
MNTQSTPVHVRLWHRDFLLMSVATFLISASVYMLIPTLPLWMLMYAGFTPLETGVAMSVFAAGLYAFGVFCTFLVQHYRRNQVCIVATACLTACIALLYYVHGMEPTAKTWGIILLQRFLAGAFFGLAQMVLSSTLIIDTAESFQRTEANHSAAWFSRFSLSLGPMAGLVVYQWFDFDFVLLGSMSCTLLAIVLILTVNFPFRSPEDNVPFVSLDRFFLPRSLPLFANLLLVSTIVGLLLSLSLSDRFYALMMGGFLLALLAQRFVFRDADLKSEVVTGLILILFAVLMMYTHPLPVVWYLAPVFLGLSVGIIASRFLLFFIKLSRHCQRGTSQSMYFLGWETGVALGVGLGYIFFFNEPKPLLITAFILAIVALGVYNYLTHDWFMKHKNR